MRVELCLHGLCVSHSLRQLLKIFEKRGTGRKTFYKKVFLPVISHYSYTQMQQKIDLNQIERFARERYIPVMLDDTKELLFNVVQEVQPKRIL